MSSIDIRRPAHIGWHVTSRICPDAFTRYFDSMADLYEVCDVADRGRSDFTTRTTVTLFGNGTVGRGHSVGQTMRRTPATIRRSGLDLINIALNFAPIVGDCDGQDVRSPPGVVQFRDMSLPSASHVERVDLINLMIPRPLAPAWMLDGAVHGLALGGETAAGRLLASHLIGLANVAAELTLDEGEAAISAALLIAERGLGRSRPATPAQSEAVYRTVRRRAAAVIQRRLLDPTLTIQAIADGAGASRSTLFRAFEPGGVRKHVQDLRLDRARAMLDRRDGRRVTVAEVAFRHGFASAAHFSRLFRARFGHAPTEAPNLSEGEKRARFEQAVGIRHDLVVDWLRERSAA